MIGKHDAPTAGFDLRIPFESFDENGSAPNGTFEVIDFGIGDHVSAPDGKFDRSFNVLYIDVAGPGA